MNDAKRHSKLWHGPITFGAVWLFIFIATLARWPVRSEPGGAIATLLAYTVLIVAYARWTEAGRRSTVAYFLAGFFPPLICFSLLTPVLPSLPPSFFQNGGAIVFVGLGVGFPVHGGPDTPLEAYLPLMWLNLLLPILIVIGGRAFVRHHRD